MNKKIIVFISVVFVLVVMSQLSYLKSYGSNLSHDYLTENLMHSSFVLKQNTYNPYQNFYDSKTHCTMIRIKGGDFKMGSYEGRTNEKPVHRVQLDDFMLSKTEITNNQFCVFLNILGNQQEQTSYWIDILDKDCMIEIINKVYYAKKGYENYPVVEVSWYGAKAYCNWAGGSLPTEAQWEYAAKDACLGETTVYAGSENIDDIAWYEKNSGGKIHPVAKKKSNVLGLHDMSGNVWEWCNDLYAPYGNAFVKNPQGSSLGTNRVLRGGSLDNFAVFCRSSSRNYDLPHYSSFDVGFRLCKISL